MEEQKNLEEIKKRINGSSFMLKIRCNELAEIIRDIKERLPLKLEEMESMTMDAFSRAYEIERMTRDE